MASKSNVADLHAIIRSAPKAPKVPPVTDIARYLTDMQRRADRVLTARQSGQFMRHFADAIGMDPCDATMLEWRDRLRAKARDARAKARAELVGVPKTTHRPARGNGFPASQTSSPSQRHGAAYPHNQPRIPANIRRIEDSTVSDCAECELVDVMIWRLRNSNGYEFVTPKQKADLVLALMVAAWERP